MTPDLARCQCDGRIVRRVDTPWPLPQWGVTIHRTLRVHTGACPLHDETLATWATWEPERVGAGREERHG